MAEIWKEITGYEGLYQVSNLGNVRRIGHLETNKNGIQRTLKDKNLKPKADAVEAIEALPPAQPERKKGKWIERNPQNSPDCRLIECSECGNAYIVGYNINYDDWIDGRNFCMKCGADLRGGSNGKNT